MGCGRQGLHSGTGAGGADSRTAKWEVAGGDRKELHMLADGQGGKVTPQCRR